LGAFLSFFPRLVFFSPLFPLVPFLALGDLSFLGLETRFLGSLSVVSNCCGALRVRAGRLAEVACLDSASDIVQIEGDLVDQKCNMHLISEI